jgi:inorganic pyrophosphatase
VRSGSQDQSVDVLVEIPRDLGKHWLREIETFFATYKELESNKSADVKGWHDADVAWQLIGEARARARGTR